MLELFKKFLAFLGFNLMKPWVHLYAYDTPLTLYKKAEIQKSFDIFKPFFQSAMLFDKPESFRDWVGKYFLENFVSNEKEFINLEFGVYKARTTNQFADILGLKNLSLYGFDSFQGLADDWLGAINSPKGTFDMSGRLPKVRENVFLIPGLIQNTLDPFLQSHEHNIGMVHLDLDTYDSTAFVLGLIRSRLKPGSIIIFDELYGYPGFEMHELKALNEFFHPNSYKFIAFSTTQAAIELLE